MFKNVQEGPPTKVRTKVAAAAQAADLGILREANTEKAGRNLLGYLVGSVAPILVLMLLVALDLRFLFKLLVFPLLIVALFCVYMTVMALLRGIRATYRYDNGLVYFSNGKVQTMRWDELDEVWLWTAGGNNAFTGMILSYVAVDFDRTRKFSTPGQGEKQVKQDSFGGRLCAVAQQLGRRVTVSGPITGRLKL